MTQIRARGGGGGRRCHRPTAFLASVVVLAAVGAPHATDAFTSPITSSRALQQKQISSRDVILAATDRNHNDNNNNGIDFAEFSRPIITAATSAFLATSLLFSNPLMPPPDAQAASAPTAIPKNKPVSTATATSIDIDLRSLPSLTRKAIVNREQLTNYLIDSIKSFKPILDVLSESDTVSVKPPKDVKGAINQALTKGDAQFVVNGEAVDVRVESVPGVIVVRVINPNIPRLPFLKDGTAALQFVDGIVDVAPAELEKAAEEVQAIEKFLMWGAPTKAPIQYKGSSLDYFLSSKFTLDGETPISLGALGDLTNSEVAFLGVTLGVTGAYSASYAYYVSLREEADREAQEKKAKVAAKKKAKMDADKKKKASEAEEKVKAAAKEKEQEAAAKETEEKVVAAAKEAKIAEVESGYSKAAEGTSVSETEDDAPPPRVRRRDAFKRMFGRGGKQ